MLSCIQDCGSHHGEAECIWRRSISSLRLVLDCDRIKKSYTNNVEPSEIGLMTAVTPRLELMSRTLHVLAHQLVLMDTDVRSQQIYNYSESVLDLSKS